MACSLGRPLLLSALVLSTSGCAALIDLVDGDSFSTVRLFATHSGTPTDGVYPDYGDSLTTRVFDNDLGWQLSLSESYITTAEVRLVRCGSDSGTAIEMFWGPCPEDFVAIDDRESLVLGAIDIADGEYCRIDVTFGPYVASSNPEDDHVNPENPLIEGQTLLISGTARRGEGATLEEVPFQILTDATAVARVDISTIDDGQPFTLAEESFARDLTIAKVYDTFFDGIDFATATPAEIEAAVFASLEIDTRAQLGDEI